MSQQKTDPHEPGLTQHRLDGEESGRQESHYLHGTHPEEQRRLSLLNDLLNERALRELGPLGGERMLDVGSGLGQFSRAMARAVGPEGLVVGIERSAEQIAAALRSAHDAAARLTCAERQSARPTRNQYCARPVEPAAA